MGDATRHRPSVCTWISKSTGAHTFFALWPPRSTFFFLPFPPHMSAPDCHLVGESLACIRALCATDCQLTHAHHRTHAAPRSASRPSSRRVSLTRPDGSRVVIESVAVEGGVSLVTLAPSQPTSPVSASKSFSETSNSPADMIDLVDLAPVPREDCPQQTTVEWDPRSPQCGVP
jgi:hypothetical protein